MIVGKIEQLVNDERRVFTYDLLPDELAREYLAEIARLRAENKVLRERLRLNGIQEP